MIWVEIQGAEPPTVKSLMTEICVKLIFFQMILSMNSERHLVELGDSAYECLQIPSQSFITSLNKGDSLVIVMEDQGQCTRR